VGGISVSRMIVGTNWFLGYSHCTSAKDEFIQAVHSTPKSIADVLEVFYRAGVDTVLGLNQDILRDAMKEASDRTGVKGILISTPNFPFDKRTPFDGFDKDAVAKVLDKEQADGVDFCLPHTCTTDMMVDRCTREVRQFGMIMKMIRERGMRSGLSTHLPESIIYADETGLDVDTYISIYNLMGFLMPIEVDWVHNVIQGANKPVITIKPFAAGQVRPLQGLTFSWNSLRDQDMVAVGTMTPKEAEELIEMSLSILERRKSNVQLQETRSKAPVKKQD
jgi:hypothetical protein